MCTRYSLTSPHETVRAAFGYGNDEPFPPRWNIAAGQPVGIVRRDQKGEREMALVRWGFVPSWVKDPREVSFLNARAETAAEKPAFRAAMRHRRCLVPADGWYAWTGREGDKRPSHVRMKAGGVMALAGLWEHWLGADGSEFETMAILTTAANRTLRAIDERMPVVLAPEIWETWLDCKRVPADDASMLLAPAPEKLLEAAAVSKAVNNPKAEGPELLKPAAGA